MSSSISTSSHPGERHGLPGQAMPPTALDRGESARFLARCAAITAALLVTPVLVNAWALFGARNIDGAGLLPYQLEKVNDGHLGDLLMFGDSTLGNAIDAHQIPEDLGRAQNFALMGHYGFYGDRNLLARIGAPRLAGRRVVVMHTADMLTRPPADLGDVVSAERPFSSIRDPRLFARLAASARFIWRVPDMHALQAMFRPRSSRIDASIDYVAQGATLRASQIVRRPLKVSEIRLDKAQELALLSEWCAAQGIEVWYCHGPLDSAIARESRLYFDECNRILRKAGFKVVNDYPLGLDDGAIGDTEDHVHPSFKQASTAWYSRVLRRAFDDGVSFDGLDVLGSVGD